MSEPAISVRDLGKRYSIGRKGAPEGLRHVLDSAVRAPWRLLRGRAGPREARTEPFWALRDVSFDVAPGEAVGVVGRNGAGKSTLLKLLSRITEPTTGSIRYRGRVASLLEVGTGFHPELTGRENIYLNAAILGLRRADINRRFDEIVAFSEVERFLDTPVKHYSSGMYVRLAFGVAAHLDPDILLVDEVLAVGDAAFQQKCLGKMGTVIKDGRTVFFVSHNLAAVASLCTRAMLIDQGRLQGTGTPQAVLDQYLTMSRSNAGVPLADRTDRHGKGALRFTSVAILNERGEPVDNVGTGQDVTVALEYRVPSGERLGNALVQIAFNGLLGQPLCAAVSRTARDGLMSLPPSGRILCRIPRLPLLPGLYTFSISCKVNESMQDAVYDAAKLSVVDGDFFGTGKLPPNELGEFALAHEWRVE